MRLIIAQDYSVIYVYVFIIIFMKWSSYALVNNNLWKVQLTQVS